MKKILLSLAILMVCAEAVFAQAPVDLRPDIYSKLKCCACKMEFAPCGCKEAVEMKAYIDALLDSGAAKEDIFYRVAKKYTSRVLIDEQVKAQVEARLLKEAGNNRPQIVLDPVSYSFGDVSKKKGSISKVFKVYNKGKSDLVITNIRVSCDCVTASLKVGKNKSPAFGTRGAADLNWQETIKPGKFGELEVVLDLAHPSMEIGHEVRDVFIASNDPLNSQLTLRVEADIVL